jgi:hypothetical protein
VGQVFAAAAVRRRPQSNWHEFGNMGAKFTKPRRDRSDLQRTVGGIADQQPLAGILRCFFGKSANDKLNPQVRVQIPGWSPIHRVPTAKL